MSELREVFDMVTKQTEPPGDPWRDQERRQRQAARNRRVVAIVTAAAIIAVLTAVFAVTRPEGTGSVPGANPPSGRSSETSHAPVIVGLDGSTGATFANLPPDAWEAALSPDGTRIAYVTQRYRAPDGSFLGFCGACAPDTTRMVVVDTNGANSRFEVLAGAPPQPGEPAWSPDGSRIAFVATRGGNQDIYVIDVRTGHFHRLTTGIAQDEFPTWSPDGGTIAYDSSGSRFLDQNGLSSTQEIWSIPASGGTPTRLTTNGEPDQAPSYSPDGSKLAFFHDGSIVWMNATGGTLHPVAGTANGWTPRWSPDGTKIAFLQYRGDHGIVSRGDTGTTESLALLEVKVVDLAGNVTDLGIEVPTSSSGASWLPSGQAVFAEAFRG
jgi:Tol biopolymer transport system component